MKYYKKDNNVTSCVSYSLIGARGKVIADFENAPCYVYLFRNRIPAETKKIIVRQPKIFVPYNKKIVAKWGAVLRNLGFPCSFRETEVNYEFCFDLSKYKEKEHLLSAMFLTRCVFEKTINYIAEMFFTSLDKKPKQDKFKLLVSCYQNLSKFVKRNVDSCMFIPLGHMLAFGGFPVKEKETLFQNFKRRGAENLYTAHEVFVQSCWGA